MQDDLDSYWGMGDFSLTRDERLRGDKIINALFTEGKTGFVFPFKYYYLESDGTADRPEVSVLVSVPKRMFKRAVKRNRLKRRTREAYRLEKRDITKACSERGTKLSIAFVYASKEEARFVKVRGSMRRMLSAVMKEIQS